jgi:phosphoglycerate dehydrogenase-like enzyme
MGAIEEFGRAVQFLHCDSLRGSAFGRRNELIARLKNRSLRVAASKREGAVAAKKKTKAKIGTKAKTQTAPRQARSKAAGKTVGVAGRLRVHVENWTDYNPHVLVTREHVAAALRRHRDLAGRIDFSFGWDYVDFDAHMKDAEVLVFMGMELDTAGFASRAPKLRWIQMTSAGVEHIKPFDWLPPGVVMTNNSGVHTDKLGEFGITGVLMLNANVPAMTTYQRERRWQKDFGTSIKGKTVAIVGVGAVGGGVAHLAKMLGMRVVGVRRDGAKHPDVDRMYRPAQLAKALSQADFVVLALPLTEETQNLVDRAALSAMKPGAGIVNIGRGATLDHAALIEGLESGRIGGAVLDAHDPEPLPADSPLWTTRNMIVSPHSASADVLRYVPLTLDVTFDNIRRHLAGQKLRNVIDIALGY